MNNDNEHISNIIKKQLYIIFSFYSIYSFTIIMLSIIMNQTPTIQQIFDLTTLDYYNSSYYYINIISLLLSYIILIYLVIIKNIKGYYLFDYYLFLFTLHYLLSCIYSKTYIFGNNFIINIISITISQIIIHIYYKKMNNNIKYKKA